MFHVRRIIILPRMKEHRATACLGHLEKSAVAEHALQEGHTDWSDVRVLDEAHKNSVRC